MLLAFAGLFLTGSPSAAEESPTAAKQPTAGGHLLVYPNRTWATFPSLQAAIDAGNVAGISAVVFYDKYNYDSTGATLTYSVSQRCTGSILPIEHRFPNFPNGWNDKASSVSTRLSPYAGCNVWMSADEGYEGECGNKWIDKHWDLNQVPYGCDNKASSFEMS